MPKVTEAHREARRQQIARAALACLRRSGVSNTSMADIIAESGLSAGAIYSNFTNKAELAAYVAGTIISARARHFERMSGSPITPLEVAIGMLESMRDEDVPFDVVVQFWAEATGDDELLAAVSATVTGLRAEFARAIEPWVRQKYPQSVVRTTEKLSIAMISVCQGYILNAALFGAADARDYLESVASALSSAPSAGN
ncbi:hypothetical protein BH11ACT2_BH11ACT2_12360 [soil metagenome]